MNDRILDLVGERVIYCDKNYGHENITSDCRDFLKVSLEEALDCSVYLAALLIELDEKDKTNC